MCIASPLAELGCHEATVHRRASEDRGDLSFVAAIGKAIFQLNRQLVAGNPRRRKPQRLNKLANSGKLSAQGSRSRSIRLYSAARVGSSGA